MMKQRLLIALGLLGFVAGCGDANPLDRQPIDGNITFDGKPLGHGSIEFVPSDGGPVTSGAVVREGKFTIAEKQGLPPGDYTVRVFAPTSKAAAATPEDVIERGQSLEPGVERIPARYNTATQLTATVTASGNNTFQFTLNGAER